MSKQITAQELGELVNNLLKNPQAVGELDSMESFQSFMTDIAQVVCDHCGGEIFYDAKLDEQRVWTVGIHGNHSLPEDGGVWRGFDPEGDLFDVPTLTACGRCHANVLNVIGTPSGEEICQDCFDAGAK